LRHQSSGAIDFQYNRSWLEWDSAIPVSLSMPLREDWYIGDPVIAVFENLLPDNEPIRRRLAEREHPGRSGNCGDTSATPTFAGMTPENWQSLGGVNNHDDGGTE
jgi:HipA-like protein